MGIAVVRSADSADLMGISKLLGELNRLDPTPELMRLQAVFQVIQQSQGLTLLVAEEGDELVGTLYLNIIPNLSRLCAPYALIENVVVSKDRRGNGIGRVLMNRAVKDAFDAGCYKVMLLTGRDASTHEFYRRCGFSSDTKTAFVMRDAVHKQEQY